MGSLLLPVMPATSSNSRFSLGGHGRLSLRALSKQGHRFLTFLATTNTVLDPSATNRSLRKFVNSSSKHVALDALSHLLSPTTTHSHLSRLAFPLYLIIAEASWFNWNAKLVADVIAVMYKHKRFDEVETLISETVNKLAVQERDLCDFYCHLIDSNAKHQLKGRVFHACNYLKQILSRSSSIYLQKTAYESMISGLCEIGLPREAENLMEEMRGKGLKPSGFEFRSLVYAYGRLGLLEDMKRTIDEMEGRGFELDTVCSNMVLASLGAQSHLLEMVSWLQRMKSSEVSLSIRTYNSVLNSCQTMLFMLEDLKSIPLSTEELLDNLSLDEANLVRELVGSSVLDEVTDWNSSEVKLDLHGMHLASSYLIFLQWIDLLRKKFVSENSVVPTEITVVCGSGKHSTVRGKSPVKGLIKEIILRMKCPLKIDRRNVGCFIGKGKVFGQWLS